MGLHARTPSAVLQRTCLKRNCARNCAGLTSFLIDGTTNRSVKGKEGLYVMLVYPDTLKPTLVFSEVLEIDDFDQTAVGMMGAISLHLSKINFQIY